MKNLIVTEMCADGNMHHYRFTRYPRNGDKWSAIRWPINEPYIVLRAQVLIDRSWVPLLTAGTSFRKITQEQFTTVITDHNFVEELPAE